MLDLLHVHRVWFLAEIFSWMRIPAPNKGCDGSRFAKSVTAMGSGRIARCS